MNYIQASLISIQETKESHVTGPKTIELRVAAILTMNQLTLKLVG